MPSVWVVDDDDEMTHAVKLMLQMLDFSVETYRDARSAAQAILAGKRPGAIFLDINMPEVSGMDMLEFLRSRKDFGRIPVVMLSSDTTDTQVDAAIAKGADGFVFKPVTIDELESALRKAMRAR